MVLAFRPNFLLFGSLYIGFSSMGFNVCYLRNLNLEQKLPLSQD